MQVQAVNSVIPEIWCGCNFEYEAGHVGDSIRQKKEHTDQHSNVIKIANQENNLLMKKGEEKEKKTEKNIIKTHKKGKNKCKILEKGRQVSLKGPINICYQKQQNKGNMSAFMSQFHANFQADLYLYVKMMIKAKAFRLLML